MTPINRLPAALLLFASHSLALAAPPSPQKARPSATGKKESGMASIYHDRRTASGEAFLPHRLTAAHRSLPFGALVRVTSPRTGRSAIVRINDRGPFVKGRIIDLSPAAAASIGLTKQMGLTRVEVLHLPPAASRS